MSIDLYTWQYCPFAQRTRIALAVKGIEHNEHELDITKKPYPDWFMKLSPNGKVPTLAEYSFGPFFQRWRIVEHYRYFDVPDTPEFSRIRAWREVSEGLDIVRDTAPSTETLIKVYADYARNYDNAKIPPGREFSAFDTEAWPLEQRPMPVRGLRLNSKE